MEALTSLIPVALYPILTIVFLFAFFLHYAYIHYVKRPQLARARGPQQEEVYDTLQLRFFFSRRKMKRRDMAPLLTIVVVFTFLAVFNLGSTHPVDVITALGTPPQGVSHMHGMYFDEIYFVRTAVEHIENIQTFEISHPPLGKDIIASSILMFGLSPFGWRLMGALAGVVMLVVMYIFMKNMFGKTIVATCGTLLLGFDFMRFSMSRIGSVDIFLVLFILLAFFFMYRYITTNPDAPFRRRLKPLALSGLFFGLSVSVKWIGFYAGIGLLIIYIIHLVQLKIYYKANKKRGYYTHLQRTLLYSLLFFVVIPVVIYYFSYVPFARTRGVNASPIMFFTAQYFRLFWENQVFMFNYHTTLVAEHPFSSPWWQWIFNIRPVFFVLRYADDTRAAFGAFGNPVVWWGGFVAMIAMVVRVFTHRDAKALFILVGYLSLLVPWMFVSRILFIYHYFPSTLFLVLALAHIFSTSLESKRYIHKVTTYAYTTFAGIVFAMFYPSLSGMYMPLWYFPNVVRWLNTWPF